MEFCHQEICRSRVTIGNVLLTTRKRPKVSFKKAKPMSRTCCEPVLDPDNRGSLLEKAAFSTSDWFDQRSFRGRSRFQSNHTD
jgi:hypothetical protein